MTDTMNSSLNRCGSSLFSRYLIQNLDLQPPHQSVCIVEQGGRDAYLFGEAGNSTGDYLEVSVSSDR
jgi:hypothetical protein